MPSRTQLSEKDNSAEHADRSRPKASTRFAEPRRGALCPQCGVGHLDYDGCLNLVCDRCEYQAGGAFT